MNEVLYLLAGLALGVLLGMALASLYELHRRAIEACELREKNAARRAVLGDAIVPPGAVTFVDNVRKTIEHVLPEDSRAVPLTSFVNTAIVEAYGRGASDLREAILAQEVLPPEVMDGVCSNAMTRVATGTIHAPSEPWPGWAGIE